MRSGLRHAARVAVDGLDPARLLGYLPRRTPPATLLSVYRQRNASNVATLIKGTRWPARLWALDTADADLPTVGVGPGSRFTLLNQLAADVPDDHWLVVADDDVRFPLLDNFVALAARCRFDLAMPAHARSRSHYFHRITGRHPFRAARQTTFVEIGPVFAVSPGARRRFLPFPETGMGWGTELLWYDQHLAGARLGIVDATPMRHLSPPAAGYDRADEDTRQDAMFRDRGIKPQDWTAIQRTLRSHRL